MAEIARATRVRKGPAPERPLLAAEQILSTGTGAVVQHTFFAYSTFPRLDVD